MSRTVLPYVRRYWQIKRTKKMLPTLHFGKIISLLTFVQFASFVPHHQENRTPFPFQILLLHYCVLSGPIT